MTVHGGIKREEYLTRTLAPSAKMLQPASLELVNRHRGLLEITKPQPSISEDSAPLTYEFGPTHRLIPIRITIIAIAVAAFFEAIQITWLRGFSLFVGSSKSFTPPLLTLLYIDCPRNFSTSR